MRKLISIVVSLTLVLSSAAALACSTEQEGLSLNQEEWDLLKQLRDKEVQSGVATGLAAWAPVLLVLSSSSAADAALTVTMHDWEKWSGFAGNMHKVLRCQQVRDIDYHLVQGEKSSPDATQFFRCLRETYDAGCA